MSQASFYKWHSKYGGMDMSLMKRMKEFEDENRRLKRIYAEEKLKSETAREAIEKSGKAIPAITKYSFQMHQPFWRVTAIKKKGVIKYKTLITPYSSGLT